MECVGRLCYGNARMPCWGGTHNCVFDRPSIGCADARSISACEASALDASISPHAVCTMRAWLAWRSTLCRLCQARRQEAVLVTSSSTEHGLRYLGVSMLPARACRCGSRRPTWRPTAARSSTPSLSCCEMRRLLMPCADLRAVGRRAWVRGPLAAAAGHARLQLRVMAAVHAAQGRRLARDACRDDTFAGLSLLHRSALQPCATTAVQLCCTCPNCSLGCILGKAPWVA